MKPIAFVSLVLLPLTACGPLVTEEEPPVIEEEPEPDPVLDDFEAGGDRPTLVRVPDSYDPAAPAPLLLFLHGYGFSGEFYENALNLTAESEARGFVYILPTGNVDRDGKPYWNAGGACCDFYGSGVDDSAYLRGLIDEAKATVNIDDERVFVMGHSNGAFMTHRLACDHAEVIASIVGISGMAASSCAPSEPVAALQVHGTADGTVSYSGGFLAAPHISAPQSAALWAERGGCSSTPRAGAPLDVDFAVPGVETSVQIFDEGCAAGGHSELWTVEGGGHVIQPSATFVRDTVDFLYAHARGEASP